MDSSTSSITQTETCSVAIPKEYKFLQILGEGSCGMVLKCVKQSTGQTVAIKIAKNYTNLNQEAIMLKTLMSKNLDKFNIIKFHGDVLMNSKTGLVFEMLDINLQDYLLQLNGPMRLEDIRTVIQQMATAFDALKRVGVIHADLKIDNIMMVDHERQPFKVKLVDFSHAIFSSQAKPGSVHQTPYYRAPEIILGLPFSEAIDIWSLGCVMAIMMFGFMLFPARFDYDALRYIIDLQGPPPEHLLNDGKKSDMFFDKTDSGQWMLKTPEEYCGPTNYSTDNRFYKFCSLDQEKMTRLEEDNMTEADERREAVELLKAMLKWDEKERITPSGILNHPFITKAYLNSHSHSNSCNEPEPSNSKAQTRTNDSMRSSQEEDRLIEEILPPGVIIVQPAPSMNRIHLEESPNEDCEIRLNYSFGSNEPEPSTSKAQTRTNESMKSSQEEDSIIEEILPPGIIMVRPAPSMNRINLEESPNEDCEISLFPAAPISLDATSIHLDTKIPSTTTDDIPDEKKRKKKNCIKRVFSWLKRELFSCCKGDDTQE